ncbi:MAG TPA: energy-coupling factor transporter ATPase [Lachnospiraceae bacterium]|nr:energy-coupling factor transporter ATPase [Lachnospiraceae bacterium]
MIQAENVTYEYIRRDDHDEVVAVETALDAVSFRIETGEWIGIMGANGSGKSTLAKHLNALLVPEEGSVIIDDIDTSDKEMVFTVRRRVGMIFQNPDNQIVHDIVEDDVAFGPENLGMKTGEIRKRVDEALSMVDLYERAGDSPMRLSGGQKARLAIAGVLAMRPKCMVFDESTAMLDPAGRDEVLAQVMKLNKEEGITVIWISHFPEEMTVADRIFIMDKGRLEMMGTPREVFSHVDRLKNMGLEVPHVTGIAYELKVRGMKLPDGILTVEELTEAIAGAGYGNNT